MWTTPTGFAAAVTARNPQHIRITFADGTVLQDADIDVSSGVHYTEPLNPDYNFTPGRAVQSEVEIAILNVNQAFSGFDFKQEFTVEIGVEDGGTTMYCPLGVFVGQKPERQLSEVINLTGYDRMVLFDKDATGWLSTLTYPRTMAQIYAALCTYCGVTSTGTTAVMVNASRSYASSPIGSTSSVTGRELLAYLAEANGCYARMNRAGVCEMVQFAATSYTLRPTDTFDLAVAEYTTPQIGKVQVHSTADDVGVIVPADSTSTQGYAIINNPFLSASSDADLRPYVSNIYTAVSKPIFSFAPIAIACECNWAVQAGDVITVIDRNGDSHSLPIFVQTIDWLGHADASLESTGDKTREEMTARNREELNSGLARLEITKTVDGMTVRIEDAEGAAAQAVATANSFSTIIGDRSGHTSSLTQEIDGLQTRISELGYGTVYMQPNEPAHSQLVQGDIWIQSQQFTTWGQVKDNYTWRQVKALGAWQSLGGIPKMYVWDGSKWQEMYDAALPTNLETEIQQLASQISLMATKSELDTLSGQVAQNTANITLTADQVLTEAKSYTDDELTDYSTTTQTATQISQYVNNNAYQKVSGINITSAGVEITGSQYVKIGSQGKLIVEAGNFKIDSSGNVEMTGKVTATSGTIGGWTLGQYMLSSGSGTSYVSLDANAQDTYAVWAGNATASSAPFRVARDGSVYLTKLYSVNEAGTSQVNLTNMLWKLYYKTVKTVDATTGTVTLSDGTTFNSARSVTLSGSWSGGILNVTASNGNGYSAALRQGVTEWDGYVATVYVNDVGQGGARSTGFSTTVNATDLVEGVTASRVQYNGSQLNIYNDSEGSLSVRVYVALSNGTSNTYTISVPYRCID